MWARFRPTCRNSQKNAPFLRDAGTLLTITRKPRSAAAAPRLYGGRPWKRARGWSQFDRRGRIL